MYPKALKKLKPLTLLLGALLCVFASYGQKPSPAFSASTTSACSPALVQFTDLSTGNPTQWRWELGNGVVSFLKNPSTSYFNPGTYTIKLVVQNAAGSDSLIKTNYLTVYPNPEPAFSVSDTAGCFPLPVRFTDRSTVAEGDITGWHWDFGDGAISNERSPLHTYTAAGNFSVTLKVTTRNGCTKTVTRTNYIKATAGVKAGFSESRTVQCKAPLTVSFSNTSSGEGQLAYTWDFGDGNRSTEASPQHTYTAAGTYSVRLITVSAQGCRDTVTKENLVHIGVKSGFTVPTPACSGAPLQFTNTSFPVADGVTWYFGDGTSSTEVNPVKTYSRGGNYTVKLISTYNGCSDTLTRTIGIASKPSASFTASAVKGCSVPFTVNFKSQQIHGATYRWDFGDGTSGSGYNPSHTYRAFGAYTVSLILTNSQGCSDTVSKEAFINVAKPVIEVDGFPRTGCTPLQVRPAFRVQSNDSVVSWRWNFGDGASSMDAKPSHTYTRAGDYTVSLTITTASGCTETLTLEKAVRVGDKPKAAFTVSPADVCNIQPVQFTDSSKGAVDQWLWDFGDTYTSTEQNPLHVMGGLGKYSVTLVTWSNTCSDTLKIVDAVNVRPPLAGFKTEGSCDNKFVKKFYNTSIGATRYRYEFGDGASSTEENPVHTYARPGRYMVTLFVTNDSCDNINRDTVWVIDQKARFAPNKEIICKGETLTVTAQNIDAGTIASWAWDFGDGTFSSNAAAASHQYSKAGTYTVTLKIRDLNGCESVRSEKVTVYGPTASFQIPEPVACLDANRVQFRDSSRTDGVHGLVKWSWDYGDGRVDPSATAPFYHTYEKTGTYSVTLKVTDAAGCMDSSVQQNAVTIAKPAARFHSSDTLSCTDKPVSFINASTGDGLTFGWNFGDGTRSLEEAPVHRYAAIGTYTVELKVTDRYGCRDTFKLPSYITVSYPKARFAVSDSVGNCPPMLVKFSNSSSSYSSLRWEFGDGSFSTLENPSHFYTTPGVFYAKLIVTGAGGCTDEAVQKITVKGPKGTFTYNADPGCLPVATTLKATTSNRTSIVWDFGDGFTHSGQDSVITHKYHNPGEYVPKMILTDASGCAVPVLGEDTIRVFSVKAAFDLDKKALCDSGAVSFRNNMVSNDLITSWHWDFGDGKTSADRNPVHQYSRTGVFNARLFVKTENGCADTSGQVPVTVNVSPIIRVISDSAACAPALISMKGSIQRGEASTLSWKWSLGNGRSADVQDPGVQSFSKDGIYPVQAVVTDKNGCTGTATRTIAIHPLPNLNAGSDALLCLDKTVQLKASGAVRYRWNGSSSLSCLDCPDPVASPRDTTLFVVSGYSAFGCVKTDSVIINVRKPFQAMAKAGDTLCAGSSLQLWAKGADLYSWTPTTGLDNPFSASPKAAPTTTTRYQVVVTDKDRCFSDTAYVPVKVYPMPVISAGADRTISAGGTTVLKASGSEDVTSWRWSPASNLSCATCPEPVASPRQTITYRVQAKNDGGCLTTDDVTVSVICNNGNLFIPNTFSPNGDGSNDRFYPRGTGIYSIRSLRIFNRWGEVVFERSNFNANDAAAGWDGTYKGQKLSPDVFIYTCEVVCSNNEILPFKGDITLLQ